MSKSLSQLIQSIVVDMVELSQVRIVSRYERPHGMHLTLLSLNFWLGIENGESSKLLKKISHVRANYYSKA